MEMDLLLKTPNALDLLFKGIAIGSLSNKQEFQIGFDCVVKF